MREIKFRAWNKEEKRMYWNVQAAYDTLHCHNVPDDSKDCDCLALTHDFSPCSFGSVLSDENYVVMQFTGLKDKNGREIYEGDIVVECSTSHRCDPEVVVYMENEWCEDGFYTGYLFWSGSRNYEVMGNIYENPKLAKK